MKYRYLTQLLRLTIIHVHLLRLSWSFYYTEQTDKSKIMIIILPSLHMLHIQNKCLRKVISGRSKTWSIVRTWM